MEERNDIVIYNSEDGLVKMAAKVDPIERVYLNEYHKEYCEQMEADLKQNSKRPLTVAQKKAQIKEFEKAAKKSLKHGIF